MKYLPIVMAVTLTAVCTAATRPRARITEADSAAYYGAVNRYLNSRAAAADINAAINDCAAGGGGTVYLSAGTYTITEPIVMNTNVRLKGTRQTSVILERGDWTPGLETGMILIYGGLSNVTISDLTLDGKGYKTYLHGIFADYAAGLNDGIRVAKVTVRNCGGGIHIRGTRNVVVEKSDVSGNGGLSADWHNLYLFRCDRVRVSYCTLNESPGGCGIQAIDTSNVRVNNSTVSDNYLHGIDFAGPYSVFILVNYNTIRNNGQFGIGTDSANGSPRVFSFIDNTISGNNNYGVNLDAGCAYGQVQGNDCSLNSPSNYSIQGIDILHP